MSKLKCCDCGAERRAYCARCDSCLNALYRLKLPEIAAKKPIESVGACHVGMTVSVKATGESARKFESWLATTGMEDLNWRYMLTSEIMIKYAAWLVRTNQWEQFSHSQNTIRRYLENTVVTVDGTDYLLWRREHTRHMTTYTNWHTPVEYR